jgi:hypothetical protein
VSVAKKRAAHWELSEAWAFVQRTEDAVVWVERAWGKALLETLKYCVKTADLLDCAGRVGPILHEMHRIKLVNGFGSMYGIGKKIAAQLEESKPVACCPACKCETQFVPESVLLSDMKKREPKWVLSRAEEAGYQRRKLAEHLEWNNGVDIPF